MSKNTNFSGQPISNQLFLIQYLYQITANTMRYSLGDNVATNPTRMGGLK